MIDLLYILAFTVGFSLFDYFAYNISEKKGWTDGIFAPYRIAQTCVQIILIAIAWAFVNGIVAIGFTLLWWTWVCDWLFYFIGEILGVYGRGYLNDEPFGNVVTWAWWTPLGLYLWIESGEQQTVINGSTLLWQSWIGILITIIIVIWKNTQTF